MGVPQDKDKKKLKFSLYNWDLLFSDFSREVFLFYCYYCYYHHY